MAAITPAILASSREDFDAALALLRTLPGVTRIQIDVVDATFGPEANWPLNNPAGLDAVADIPQAEGVEYEIDLMCVDAENTARAFGARSASRFVVHVKNGEDAQALLAELRSALPQACVGIALDVVTPPASAAAALAGFDFVQVMGIETIGVQGQPFDTRALELLRIIHALHPGLPLQVDGGVSMLSAKQCLQAGATMLVAGSSILQAGDPKAALAELQALAV